MQIKDNKAEISFDFVYSGLTALGEELKGFLFVGRIIILYRQERKLGMEKYLSGLML